jgi:hypothetical protein
MTYYFVYVPIHTFKATCSIKFHNRHAFYPKNRLIRYRMYTRLCAHQILNSLELQEMLNFKFVSKLQIMKKPNRPKL